MGGPPPIYALITNEVQGSNATDIYIGDSTHLFGQTIFNHVVVDTAKLWDGGYFIAPVSGLYMVHTLATLIRTNGGYGEIEAYIKRTHDNDHNWNNDNCHMLFRTSGYRKIFTIEGVVYMQLSQGEPFKIVFNPMIATGLKYLTSRSRTQQIFVKLIHQK